MFETIADVKRANAEAGGHFFDRSTLAFFDSQVGRTVHGGRYFVTSEQFHGPDGSEPRRWTIREVLPTGDIETVGEFQQYESPAEAVAAIRRLLDGSVAA